MLTQRDRRIIRFINDFRCATTSQIKSLFYSHVSMRYCQQRLRQLTTYSELKRFRGHIDDEYIYYTRQKPKEIEHMLWRVDSYIQLNKDYNLVEFIPEYNYYGIRADAYFEVWQHGLATGYFLEIQKSHRFDLNKYDTPYQNGHWIEKWNRFPEVIIKSDLKLNLQQSFIQAKIFKLNQKIVI